MTDIDVPDWVAIEAAKALHLHGADSMCSDTDWPDLTDSERSQYIGWAKASLRAALSAWVVPVHQVATPAPDWRDINSRHLQMIQGSTATTRTLYKLRQEKPE